MKILKPYLKSNKEDLNLYGVYLIKNYLSLNEENNDKELMILFSQLNVEYLTLIIDLLEKNNNKISFFILWILINLSYVDFNENLFSSNLDNIYKIACFLGNNKNDKILTYRGIWLLRNITSNNNKIKEELLKYNIIEYYNEIYHKYCLDNEFAHELLICLGNFTVNPNKKYIKQYIPIIKLIKVHLNESTNLKCLNKYLFFFHNLFSLNSNEILKEMVKEEIYKKLINIYPFKNKSEDDEDGNGEEENKNHIKSIRILIIKILGKILSIDEDDEDYTIKKLIDYGIINFLNKVIDSFYATSLNNDDTNIKLIKNISFCLSNICTGDYDQMSELYKSQILLKLIKIGKDIYMLMKNYFNLNENEVKLLQEAFREICYVFCLTIINSVYDKLIPFAKYQNSIVVVFIIEALKIFQNKYDLIELGLKALCHLINYDKEIEEFNKKIRVSDYNITFSEIMERNGIKNTLELLMKSNNHKISHLSEEFYDNFYSFHNSK